MVSDPRPSLAVWKFSSCDGCQLTLLDCEDELLALAGEVRISSFLEASSAVVAGPYDLSLVEGSVTTTSDAERIQEVRAVSKTLVTIGACATAGGIQALRNVADVPEFISTLADSTPISAHVAVDLELRGCPIDRHQLLELITAYLQGRRPDVPTYSVCMECKQAGHVCVAVASGTPCLGPATQAGCGALCPGYHRGCYGCFGPAEAPNTDAIIEWFHSDGMSAEDLVRVFRTFNTASPAFDTAARQVPVVLRERAAGSGEVGT